MRRTRRATRAASTTPASPTRAAATSPTCGTSTTTPTTRRARKVPQPLAPELGRGPPDHALTRHRTLLRGRRCWCAVLSRCVTECPDYTYVPDVNEPVDSSKIICDYDVTASSNYVNYGFQVSNFTCGALTYSTESRTHAHGALACCCACTLTWEAGHVRRGGGGRRSVDAVLPAQHHHHAAGGERDELGHRVPQQPRDLGRPVHEPLRELGHPARVRSARIACAPRGTQRHAHP